MVLDEEEQLLGDAKDPGWLVPWEESAVSLVPEMTFHLNLIAFVFSNMLQ